MRNTADRRTSPRKPAVMAVKNEINSSLVLCQSRDFSEAGMALLAPGDTPLTTHAPMRLQFALPGTDILITAEAEAIRVAPQGRFRLAAVRFTAIDDQDRQILASYCKSIFRTKTAA